MSYLNRLFFLTGSLFAVYVHAYEYPSVHSVSGIKQLYLKTPEEIQARKEEAHKQFHRSLEEFLKTPIEKTSSSHLLQSFDVIIGQIEHAMEVLSLFSLVEPNNELRDVYTATSQELKQDFIRTLADTPALYELFSKLFQKEETKATLSHKEKYYLASLLNEMKLEGFHLPEETRSQVKQLKIELTKLSEEFSRNIQEDHSSISVKRSALEGLDEHFVKQLQSNEKEEYVLTCDYPTYYTVMRACLSEETRKELYRAFTNRAYPKNLAVLNQMIAKRDQLAHFLGFQSFAHYQLCNEMVKKPEVAGDFLDKLSQDSLHKQHAEMKAIQEVVPSIPLTTAGKIEPWNTLYAQQKVKEIRYQLNQELIKEYFPLSTTIDGLIWLFESFFDLKMTKEPIQGLWHEDVQLLKVASKQTQKVYGYVLLDLFPRANKYSHACHGTMVAGIDLPDGTSTTSLSLVIANFPKPTPERPSLMYLSDVKTFFHELGHGIHALMGRTQFVGTSGTHVKVDFVELPSQMLEEWLCEPEILKKISSHYQTKQPLPDEWIEKIKESRSVGTGQTIGGQCLFSKFSLGCFLPGEYKDTNALLAQLHQDLDLYAVYDPQSHFQAAFGHLDEYGARYYGYLWSRVFGVDVFEQIKKEGLLNPAAGARYVKEILGQGGSEDPALLLKAYLGREPSQEPFLQHYGIK